MSVSLAIAAPTVRISSGLNSARNEAVYSGKVKTLNSDRAADFIQYYVVAGIMVEVRWEGGQYVALEGSTGMFGEGDNAIKAGRLTLLGTLRDHHADLLAHRATGIATRYGRLLNALEPLVR